MPITEQATRMLLATATELAEARRHDSDTCEEWDGLERAILVAEESTIASYALERGAFVRRSTATDGTAREESIDIDDIEIIAQTIEEDIDRSGGWFVVDQLVAPSGRTWLKCLVAIEFMKRAGLLRERALDNRIYVESGFSADAAMDAFRIDANLT